MVGPLTLPEEFALLSLADTGRVIDSGQAKVGCAVAELGELALRGKLLIRRHESKVFGLSVIRQISQVIELVDAAPVGLAWADELLAELANETEAVAVAGSRLLWRRRRRNAFLWHRDALVARGLVRYVPSSGLFRRERHLPDSTMRNRLINEVRLATEVVQDTGGGRRLDVHTMFLSGMVIRSELDRDLGVVQAAGGRRRWHVQAMFLSGMLSSGELDMELGVPRPKGRRARDRARGIGAVESVPEPLRHTSEVLAGLVPKRSRHRGDGDDVDDGE